MNETDDGFRLSTGREFYAFAGILGIDANGDISYGYDGRIHTEGDEDGWGPWTPEERKEVATYVMGLWAKFGGIAFP